MKTTNYCIITTTIDDENIAEQISTALLQDHLVVCVQSHTVQSKYHWNGTLETSEEILLQMKTKASLFDEIKVKIKALHSYDVPEIIMTPIIDANESYLKWIEEETR
jgi:periplasmic divalent cation tolerance protein